MQPSQILPFIIIVLLSIGALIFIIKVIKDIIAIVRKKKGLPPKKVKKQKDQDYE